MFINTVPVGKTFTSAEYITAIGHKENVTRWKRASKNTHYNCHQYKGYLKRAGFISSVKHGTWKVDRHIPEWFDHGHLSILLCYYKRDKDDRYNILTYKGMDRAMILAQLDKDTQVKPVEKIIPANKNYIQPENKIDNTTGLRVESNSATQPIISETKKTLHSPDTQEFSKNIALLEAAFNLVGDCTTPDRFMQARLYNIQVLIQDVTSAFSEKKDFLTNN
jgi:hypothetical protein